MVRYGQGILICGCGRFKILPHLRGGVVFCAYGMIMIGLVCNLIAMKFYPLTKEKMEEIQDEVAQIKMKAMAENA